MKIIKRILLELAFMFRWKDEKYGEYFLERHRELVDEAIKKMDISADSIKISQPNIIKNKKMNKEQQEYNLEKELRATRNENSLICLIDITSIMKKVFDKAELEVIKKNI